MQSGWSAGWVNSGPPPPPPPPTPPPRKKSHRDEPREDDYPWFRWTGLPACYERRLDRDGIDVFVRLAFDSNTLRSRRILEHFCVLVVRDLFQREVNCKGIYLEEGRIKVFSRQFMLGYSQYIACLIQVQGARLSLVMLF